MAKNISIDQLKPTPGNVLVRPENIEKATPSGIILPEEKEQKSQFGEVLAVGDSLWESGVKEIKAPVKVGDKVFYKKWGGNEVTIDDEEYQLLSFGDVLAKI